MTCIAPACGPWRDCLECRRLINRAAGMLRSQKPIEMIGNLYLSIANAAQEKHHPTGPGRNQTVAMDLLLRDATAGSSFAIDVQAPDTMCPVIVSSDLHVAAHEVGKANICALHKILLTLSLNSREIAPDGARGKWNAPVSVKNIIPSHLPSFLLPCPHCGNRMVVRAVTPMPLDGGSARSDLDDITYGCVQCGTTMTRTVRS